MWRISFDPQHKLLYIYAADNRNIKKEKKSPSNGDQVKNIIGNRKIDIRLQQLI